MSIYHVKADGPHILIVEDDLRSAILAKALLKINGLPNAYSFNSGRELTEGLDRLPHVDLVLLDLQLPGEDGYQILHRLRARTESQAAHFVAMTAQVLDDEVNNAEAQGFDSFLGKPLNFDRFPGQIRRILAGERVWEPR